MILWWTSDLSGSIAGCDIWSPSSLIIDRYLHHVWSNDYQLQILIIDCCHHSNKSKYLSDICFVPQVLFGNNISIKFSQNLVVWFKFAKSYSIKLTKQVIHIIFRPIDYWICLCALLFIELKIRLPSNTKIFNSNIFIPQKDICILRNNIWMKETLRKPPEEWRQRVKTPCCLKPTICVSYMRQN